MSKTNIITKFIKGEITLWKSFWLVGYLYPSILSIIFYLFALSELLFLIYIVFYPFYLIGIWRSANNYKGKKIWKYLTKTWIVVSTLVLLFTMTDMEYFYNVR